MKYLFVPSLAAASFMTLLAMAGCQGTGGHRIINAPQEHGATTGANAGHVMGCQKCYDKSVAVQQQYGKPSALPSTYVISKHMCEDCKTEVTTYAENGKAMIKCAKCAPEGVACDKCLPPKAKS